MTSIFGCFTHEKVRKLAYNDSSKKSLLNTVNPNHHKVVNPNPKSMPKKTQINYG